MTPTEESVYRSEQTKQDITARIEAEIQAVIRRRKFYQITGRTHLQQLNIWIVMYERRFGQYDSNDEHWKQYFRRRMNFIWKLMSQL